MPGRSERKKMSYGCSARFLYVLSVKAVDSIAP